MGKFKNRNNLKKKSKNLRNFSKIISFEDNLVLPTIFGDQDKTLKLENQFNVSIFQEEIS